GRHTPLFRDHPTPAPAHRPRSARHAANLRQSGKSPQRNLWAFDTLLSALAVLGFLCSPSFSDGINQCLILCVIQPASVVSCHHIVVGAGNIRVRVFLLGCSHFQVRAGPWSYTVWPRPMSETFGNLI